MAQEESWEKPRLELRVPQGAWSEEARTTAVSQLTELFAVQLRQEPQLMEPLLGHVALELFLPSLASLPAAIWTGVLITVLRQCFWRSARGTPTELTLIFWNRANHRVAQARLLTENDAQVARVFALLPALLNERARDMLLVFDARQSARRRRSGWLARADGRSCAERGVLGESPWSSERRRSRRADSGGLEQTWS